MSIEKQLMELRETIDEAKTGLAEAEGATKELLADLKTKHGCSSLAEAKKKLTKLEAEEDAMTNELDEGVTALKAKMGGSPAGKEVGGE